MHKTYINEKLLRKHGACSFHRERFVDVFGRDDVPVTLENIEKAYNEGLNLRWLLEVLDENWWDRAYRRYSKQSNQPFFLFMEQDAKKSLIRLLKRTGRL